MPSVDLVCSYDAATTPVAWTNGTNISTNNGQFASIASLNGQLRSLNFTTDAATAIPAGATLTAVQLIARFGGLYLATYGIYLKNPGSFTDGGMAAHTLTSYVSGLSASALVSTNLAIERPSILTADLSSGQVRMFNDDVSGFSGNYYLDYLSLRVTYTEASTASLPVLFLGELM